MLRNVFIASVAVASMIASSNVRAAEVTGISACDEFIAKYEACIGSKLPAEQQAAFKPQIEQLRKGWAEAGKNPSAKAMLETTCKQTSEQLKTAMKPYGCTF